MPIFALNKNHYAMNIRKIQSKAYLSILLLLLPLLANAERVEINGIYYVPDSKTYQA